MSRRTSEFPAACDETPIHLGQLVRNACLAQGRRLDAPAVITGDDACRALAIDHLATELDASAPELQVAHVEARRHDVDPAWRDSGEIVHRLMTGQELDDAHWRVLAAYAAAHTAQPLWRALLDHGADQRQAYRLDLFTGAAAERHHHRARGGLPRAARRARARARRCTRRRTSGAAAGGADPDPGPPAARALGRSGEARPGQPYDDAITCFHGRWCA